MAGTGNFASRLASGCRRAGWDRRSAYVCEGADHTHAEVHEGAARFSAHLAERGFGPGRRLLIALPDGIAFAWAFLGAVRLGALAIPVDPSLSEAEFAELAVRLRADAVLREASEVEEPVARTAAGEAFACGEEAPAYAQLTSGTTGPPKAALHRHGDPFVYQRAFGGPVLGLRPGETVLSVSKMFFAYGLGNSLLYPLMAGCRAVLHAEKPRPDSVASLVERHQVDVLFAVPSFYARLLSAGHASELSRLRLAISAGEALPRHLHEEFERQTGVTLLDSIGCTEVGQAFASNRPREVRHGTAGRPLPPYRVRVVGEASGEPLAAGERGLLQVSGPSLDAGCLDAAAGDRRENGWLCTNDLAFLDDEGFLHLCGRADDVEIVSGRKIHPGRLEEKLAAHPGVLEAAVCAVRDRDGVARLTAFIAREEGGPSDDELSRRLLESVREVGSGGRTLHSVVFLPALPRTATGKLMRSSLREGAPGAKPRRVRRGLRQAPRANGRPPHRQG